jgi:RNA 2',3'-cyclic 3'-phosphodiesterase
VSPEVRDNLVRVEEELGETRADIRLVERENLHFTVKFLGEVSGEVVETVDQRLRPLELPRMEVGVRGLGAFPDARRPRVVWAGVAAEDLPGISGCGQRVIDALEGLGQADERKFHPHITLARVRSPRNHETLAAFLRDSKEREFGRTPITALKLKSSALSPHGPTYRDVKEYDLR